MKSVESRFNYITEKNPFWCSYICFAEAVKEQRFKRQAIHRWFQKLANKNEYDKSDKKALLVHLENLTNLVRTTKIKGRTNRQQV